MKKAAEKLKELRKSAVPRVTVRAMADALEMPLGSYARYESTYDYKKTFLPIDLTRKIARVLAAHGIDAAETMKLAGLNEVEADEEGEAVEASQPQVQFVSMSLALPNEAALRDMFRSLLVLVPEGASKDETAEILARRLPSGLAAIGPLVLDPSVVPSPARAEGFQSPSTDHRASAPSSRT
jgi:hypothetical protein